MNRQFIYEQLSKYVDRQGQDLPRATPGRIVAFHRGMLGDDNDLPDVAQELVTSLRAHRDRVRYAVIWGSYATARESGLTFSLKSVNDRAERTLLWGPSDIDALIVVRDHIPIPSKAVEYIALTRTLSVAYHTRMDVYRDVFQVQEHALAQWLQTLPKRYVDCYVAAHIGMGIILKDDPTIHGVIKEHSSGADVIVPTDVVIKRRCEAMAEYLLPIEGGVE